MIYPEPFEIALSKHDHARFDVQTAHATNVTLDTIPSMMQFCQENEVELLIARCRTTELNAVHEMETLGFSLMGTLVTYELDLTQNHTFPKEDQHRVRSLQPGEQDRVREIAVESFRDFQSHYHADEKLDRTKCDNLYPDWAYDLCNNRDEDNQVFVCTIDDQLVGFFSTHLITPEIGGMGLTGILPAYRRQGCLQSLLIAAIVWYQSREAKKHLPATQIKNISMQKTYTRLGYKLSYSQYTFHKWID